MNIEEKAKSLYKINSNGWLNAKTWNELTQESKQIWINFAKEKERR
jgi:hypothetical protein